MKQYDAVIVGFGKGGKTIASAFAKQGKRVAMIEKSSGMYGGTCINIACIPTKSLIHQSGERSSSPIPKEEFYEHAIEEKDQLTSFLRDNNFHMLADEETVTVYTGTATFVDDTTLSVKTEHDTLPVTGERIFINTGSTPVIPPITGVDESERVYDSTSLQQMKELPEKLIIIGGGYIGLEFASMYANFGADVTVIDSSSSFLPNEDRDIAEAVKEVLEAKGITIVLESDVQAIDDQDDRVVVTYETNEQKTKKVSGSAVLLATGRKPNTDGLGLENTSIEVDDQGAVQVDDSLQTSVGSIWAIGDVNGGPQFTYISLDDYRIIENHLFGDGTYTKKNRSNVPNSVFIEPVLSHVGLNETEANEKGIDYKVGTLPASAIPRARLMNETEGLLKVLVDPTSDEILGCTLFCAHSSEMINTVRVAMEAKLPYTFLRDTIFTHPSMSEALNDLFATVDE